MWDLIHTKVRSWASVFRVLNKKISPEYEIDMDFYSWDLIDLKF